MKRKALASTTCSLRLSLPLMAVTSLSRSGRRGACLLMRKVCLRMLLCALAAIRTSARWTGAVLCSLIPQQPAHQLESHAGAWRGRQVTCSGAVTTLFSAPACGLASPARRNLLLALIQSGGRTVRMILSFYQTVRLVLSQCWSSRFTTQESIGRWLSGWKTAKGRLHSRTRHLDACTSLSARFSRIIPAMDGTC